jgi:hypothetical protein
MISIRYAYDDKETVFKVPTDVSEVTFSQFLDFRKEWDKYAALEDEEEKAGKALRHLLKAVSYVVEGDLSILPFGDGKKDYTQAFREGTAFDIGEELTVIGLYAYISHLIGGYKPEERDISKDYTCEHNSTTYYLTPDRARRMMSGISYTVGEVMEVEEADRMYRVAKKQQGDPDGTFEFTATLRSMAILLRPDGHVLPWREVDLERYVEQQSEKFQDLTMDVVLDVRFFLRSTLIDLATKAGMQLHSMGQLTWGLLVPPKKQSKRTEDTKPTGKRRAKLFGMQWGLNG